MHARHYTATERWQVSFSTSSNVNLASREMGVLNDFLGAFLLFPIWFIVNCVVLWMAGTAGRRGGVNLWLTALPMAMMIGVLPSGPSGGSWRTGRFRDHPAGVIPVCIGARCWPLGQLASQATRVTFQ
jgi:hypothetical protein